MAMASLSLLSTLNLTSLLLLSLLLPLRLLSLLAGRRRTPATRSLLIAASAVLLLVSLPALSDPAGSGRKDGESEMVRPEMEAEIQDLKDQVFRLAAIEPRSVGFLDDFTTEGLFMQAEIQDHKDQIFRLGSILEESAKKLSVKTELLEEDGRIIQAMERDIQYLIDEQEKIKKSLANSRHTNNFEDEVQLLKDESQNLKSNVLNMEFLAKDTEKKLETLNSEIKKIENIISEQWIQVRQFEQAFQLTKIMASKVHKRNKPDESPVKNTYKKALRIAEAIYLQYAKDINTVKSLLLEASSSFISHANYSFNLISQIAQKHFLTGFRLIRRIRLRYISDKGVPDSFFMGCSVSSKNCLPHVYKHYKSIKSIVHKCHNQVNDFVNRLIEST